MAISLRCPCGARVKTGEESRGKRGKCLSCGRTLLIPAAIAAPTGAAGAFEDDDFAARLADSLPDDTSESHDPPEAAEGASQISVVLSRMFDALLDPRSIQWMLTIGGGLFVLGLLIWLVSWGIFQNPVILATALLIGTLAIMCAGWWVVLATRFRIAGQALTFLGCVVAPLNLWFYHAQALITLDNKLWVGGLVCCLLYVATVYVLRDPLFMYAVEAGLTLTATLFLAELGLASDLGYLTVAMMALGRSPDLRPGETAPSTAPPRPSNTVTVVPSNNASGLTTISAPARRAGLGDAQK